MQLQGLVTRQDDPQPLMRRWGFRQAYPTVEALLETEELDALFVLTPRSEHVAATRLALDAGVDVFCEKPLATSASDAKSLAELAAARERVLMVGFNRRFAPVYEAGRAAFGESGASFCVAQKNRAGSEYRATFENAIHMVDLLRWYCGGEPVDVSAHAARDAGGWSEKLDAYGDATTVNVTAPDRISVGRPDATTVREMSPEAFGWATATQTFGFAGAVHHFLDRVRDRAEPMTSGSDAVKTQLLLDRILDVAGLPTEEQPGRAWSSHAKK